jgi:hypothetical protein
MIYGYELITADFEDTNIDLFIFKPGEKNVNMGDYLTSTVRIRL